MDQQRLVYLVDRLNEGKATDEELVEYNAYLNSRIAHEGDWDVRLGDEQKAKAELLARIEKGMPLVKVKRIWPRIAAAASILLVCSAGVWFYARQPHTEQVAKVQQDIAPGHNQATLTLANGKKIVLTKGLNGLLATQGKTNINATGNNIVYNTNKAPLSTGEGQGGEGYNTLSTTRGEQSPYPLVLADGTKVWLNAESSIKFPAAFNGKERVVQVTGEAYFEVVHNAKQPFKVLTATQTINDIGTSFDVNAYTDEAKAHTTLIEGSVEVNHLVLRPGQETDGGQVKTANLAEVTAWKNGKFHFEGQDIRTIMRQLARWYDIDVSYEGAVSNKVFYAGISRQRNISAVLNLLEQTQGIHFKIEGRRVTISE